MAPPPAVCWGTPLTVWLTRTSFSYVLTVSTPLEKVFFVVTFFPLIKRVETDVPVMPAGAAPVAPLLKEEKDVVAPSGPPKPEEVMSMDEPANPGKPAKGSKRPPPSGDIMLENGLAIWGMSSPPAAAEGGGCGGCDL